MTTIRAMGCHEFGPPENLTVIELPSPAPEAEQVVVEVHAIGVNFTDILGMGGRSQLKRFLPFVPGVEAAGVVKSVGGGVSQIKVGQRVLGIRTSGTYAEEVVFQEDEVCEIPDEMDMQTACTFFVVAMTADYAIIDRAKLQAGENLLVLGAGGGAGLAAIEIGKACGAKVVAAASTQEKLDLAVARGADATVLYPRDNLDVSAQKALAVEFMQHAVRENNDGLTIGEINSVRNDVGYHVVFDGVGGAYTEPAMRALGWHGRYLSIGFAAGVPKVNLAPILFKDGDIMGIQPGDDNVRLPGRTPERMVKLFRLFKEGSLRPQITASYPMAEAAKVLRKMADRQTKGRVVLITHRGTKNNN